ncbi:protein Spindly [Belonocnema kinseyi]|uniref:protein Spindly n=1 Tax=Belonocnema kinseyi TaxID=2817044 RepID=UPI00143DEA85|nr:protein Spindly [Belonocnema kinseyi]
MSEVSFSNSGIESLLNESLHETSDLRNQVTKLTNKNEEYQQKVHVLRRELESTSAMYKEVKELLEEFSSKQSEKIDQKVQELTDKHNHERKCYEARIDELEDDLISKLNENSEMRTEIAELRIKIKMPAIQEISVYEEESEHQENQITELMTLLQEKTEKLLACEETCKYLETQNSEMQDIIQGLKVRVVEKDQVIESTQEELAECRTELNALKTAPVPGSKKGNSLFAEVEDRRQVMMEKMNSMRASYHEMKRSFLSKENEIKVLKTERAALIRKWEDSAVEAVEQETALVDAYKSRIADLEKKLKEEQKKHKQLQNEVQQPGSNISYFQSLLNSKKKEIEELRTQIEDNAIRTLLEEEKSYKFGKRLRYWRYKAMSLEASLLAVQSQLQTDPNSSSMEILHLIKQQMSDKTLKADADIDDEFELSLKPQIVDETKVSLDSLIRPKSYLPPNMDSTESSEMSLTNIVNDTIVMSSQSVPCRNQNSHEKSCTLNRTADMSMTEVIETGNSDCKLKLEFEEELANFLPTSASSCLQENAQTNMQLVPFNPESNSNKENVSTLGPESCSNKENISTVGNASILKSALSKTGKKGQDEIKGKKALRFTEDTSDPKEGLFKRLKNQQKKYPVLFISSKPSN